MEFATKERLEWGPWDKYGLRQIISIKNIYINTSLLLNYR